MFKVLRRAEWESARQRGVFSGSSDDARDGFIHMSTLEQLPGTLAKHFAGEAGLVLLQIAVDTLGPALKWEPSRGGALFPHLYGDLPLAAVSRTFEIGMTAAGKHALPPDLAA